MIFNVAIDFVDSIIFLFSHEICFKLLCQVRLTFIENATLSGRKKELGFVNGFFRVGKSAE